MSEGITLCLPVPRESRQHSLELLTCDSVGSASPVQPQHWVMAACRLSPHTTSSQVKAASKMLSIYCRANEPVCGL